MPNFDKEISSSEFLAGIEDADERERFRREFCILEFDERGHRGFSAPTGNGPHAALNRAIIGGDFPEHLYGTLQDAKLADELRLEQQAAAAAVRHQAPKSAWSDTKRSRQPPKSWWTDPAHQNPPTSAWDR